MVQIQVGPPNYSIMIENINERLTALTDLVEAMIKTQQDMYGKIEFLEKRINLVEKVNDYQDKEMEVMSDEQAEQFYKMKMEMNDD